MNRDVPASPDLPEDWSVQPLKRLVQPTRPITYGIVQCGPDVDDGVPYVRPVDMDEEEGVTLEELQRTAPEIAADYERSVLSEGDLVVSIGPSSGKVMIVPPELEGGNLTQGTARVAPSGPMDRRFLFWYLRSRPARTFWVRESTGATFMALNLRILRATPTPQPPRTTQSRIASFLDHHTAHIDQLIEKKQRLLDLLEEKRQAVITRAVTKGLDPKAETKNPSIDWIDEIPHHWDVISLKHLAKIQTGISKGRRRDQEETQEVPYLRVANVQDGYLELEEIKTLEVTPEELERYSLQAGDVLMNEGGDIDKLGRGAVWSGEIDPCIHQNHVFAIRPDDTGDSEWISRLTESVFLKHYFMVNAKRTTNLASISARNIGNTPIIWPPEVERDKILDYIYRELNQLGQVQLKTERGIDLLQEKRQALITAAVTGQIDVSDWESPEGETTETEAEPATPEAVEP